MVNHYFVITIALKKTMHINPLSCFPQILSSAPDVIVYFYFSNQSHINHLLLLVYFNVFMPAKYLTNVTRMCAFLVDLLLRRSQHKSIRHPEVALVRTRDIPCDQVGACNVLVVCYIESVTTSN